MIYGYLRVSSDEQDVNSQKQGVEKFAADHGWAIDEYISDEGVSGGKDPDKRKLGPLLKKIHKGDLVICSEISRLGRDLYMVMDILHFCMKQEAVIYTVKDKFVLGDDMQSKVLAFAFGLSAEIERQMIRQRTKEGLALRMKMGVLLGRPLGGESADDTLKLAAHKEEVITQYKWGVPQRRLAANFGVDRNTLLRTLVRWGAYQGDKTLEHMRAVMLKEKEMQRKRRQSYKDTPYKIVPLDRDKIRGLILADKTLPEIADECPSLTYEQLYDSILCDVEFNPLYRRHGQQRVKKQRR